MCICLNCKYIYKCEIYKLIEIKHNQKKIENNTVIFDPYSPIIVTKTNTKTNELEWDVIECLSFQESCGAWIL